MHDSTREEINQYNKYQTFPLLISKGENIGISRINLDTILGDVSHVDLFAKSGSEDLKRCEVYSIEGIFQIKLDRK